MSFENWDDCTALIVGTGPSLTPHDFRVIDWTRAQCPQLRIFTVNNAFFELANVDVHFSCNEDWWDYYMRESDWLRSCARDRVIAFWTWNQRVAAQYELNYVEGRWSGGPRNVTSLSTDRSYIHFGHGSGYEILGIAYHYGIRRFLLAGYDLKYPEGYEGARRIAGGHRHYFGEYPRQLQHWPGISVDKDGTLRGLLEIFKTIDCDALGLEIINCCPTSAMEFFPKASLTETLRDERQRAQAQVQENTA